MTFSGTADSELPDLLALDSGTARGVAIGLEQADGTALALNTPLPAYQLMAGDNTLTFAGYVQGKPSALQGHSIVRGASVQRQPLRWIIRRGRLADGSERSSPDVAGGLLIQVCSGEINAR